MEGRSPKGIAVVLVNCKDPAQEAGFNDWYDNKHLPDVTGPGIYRDATRYANARAKGGAEDPKYLAFYETDREDAGEAWKEAMSHRDKWTGGTHPALGVAMMGVFKRTGNQPPPPQGKKTRGVLVAMTECTDPAREAEFIRWYDGTHIPDILNSGLYWTASRFEHTQPEAGKPRYIAVYETELDAQEALQKLQPLLAKATRFDAIKVHLMGTYNLTYSQVTGPVGAARA